MINILSSKDKRYLKTLQILFKKNDYIKVNELSSELNVVKSTIISDIVNINSIIYPMNISTSHYGCKLTMPINVSIDYIYQCILKSSLEYELIELIFFEKYSTLSEYASALFISFSSLKRMISKINSVTKTYGFEINYSTIQLVGNETTIITMIMNLFYEKYCFDDLPFHKEQKIAVEQLLDIFFIKRPSFYSPDIEKIKRYSLARIIRLKNGHGLSNSSPKEADFSIIDFSAITNFNFCEYFKYFFDISLNSTTLKLIFYPFRKEKFINSFEELIELKGSNKFVKTTVSEINSFVLDISHHLDIEIPTDEEFFLGIYNSTLMTLEQDYLLYDKKRKFVENIYEDFPFFYEKISKLKHKISDVPLHELYQFLYSLIITWPQLLPSLRKKVPTINAGIILDLNLTHSKFICEMMNNFYSKNIKFDVINAPSLDHAIQIANKKDFLLTNISNISSLDIPVISMGIYPTFRDFEKIDSLAKQVRKDKINLF